MRLFTVVFVILAATPTLSLHAASVDDKIQDATQIAALENRANLASPREQCFLYAELVHQMAELAGRQLSDGDARAASLTLAAIQTYASKIHIGLADDSKRMKNAEMLMRHTAFRLKEVLLGSSADDRPTVEATLKQLNQVQAELMLRVFRH